MGDMPHVTPLTVYLLRGCQVRIWSLDYMDTLFPDGGVCPALLTDTEPNRELAVFLGYAGEHASRRMHFEHELVHQFLAEAKGLTCSPVIRRVAGGPDVDSQARALEEGVVLAFQRYLNAGHVDDALMGYLPAGEWAALARDFRARFQYADAFQLTGLYTVAG